MNTTRQQREASRGWKGDGEEGRQSLITHMINRVCWTERGALGVKQIEQRCSFCLLVVASDRRSWIVTDSNHQSTHLKVNVSVCLHAGHDSLAPIISDDAVVWRIVWRMRANWALHLGLFSTLFVSLLGSNSFCCVCDGSLDYFMIEMSRQVFGEDKEVMR